LLLLLLYNTNNHNDTQQNSSDDFFPNATHGKKKEEEIKHDLFCNKYLSTNISTVFSRKVFEISDIQTCQLVE